MWGALVFGPVVCCLHAQVSGQLRQDVCVQIIVYVFLSPCASSICKEFVGPFSQM